MCFANALLFVNYGSMAEDTLIMPLTHGTPSVPMARLTNDLRGVADGLYASWIYFAARRCQARPSGASIDAAMKYQIRAGARSQNTDNSVWTYDSKAKSVRSADRLPVSLALQLITCELQLAALLSDQNEPSAIAPHATPSSAQRTPLRT